MAIHKYKAGDKVQRKEFPGNMYGTIESVCKHNGEYRIQDLTGVYDESYIELYQPVEPEWGTQAYIEYWKEINKTIIVYTHVLYKDRSIKVRHNYRSGPITSWGERNSSYDKLFSLSKETSTKMREWLHTNYDKTFPNKTKTVSDKSDQRIAIATIRNSGHPVGSKIVQKGTTETIWVLADDVNGSAYSHTIGKSCEWLDTLPKGSTAKEGDTVVKIYGDNGIIKIGTVCIVEKTQPNNALFFLVGYTKYFATSNFVIIKHKEESDTKVSEDPFIDNPITNLTTAATTVGVLTQAYECTVASNIVNSNTIASNSQQIIIPQEETMKEVNVEVKVNGKVVSIDAGKEAKIKTALEAKPSLIAQYYDFSGRLVLTENFSGKKALEKATNILRQPGATGWTMVPYYIGKASRVKLELEEV